MSEVSETLDQRGSIYGDYRKGVIFRAELIAMIKKAYKDSHGDREMSIVYEQFFIDIAGKLSRLSVSPDHIDSWVDMAGYSTLIFESLKRTGEGKGE